VKLELTFEQVVLVRDALEVVSPDEERVEEIRKNLIAQFDYEIARYARYIHVFEMFIQGMYQSAITPDKPWLDIEAFYDVSTIDRGETILFKKSGTGPDQITLWTGLSPTAQFVLDELDKGRFTC
jgi:hypothetical protein